MQSAETTRSGPAKYVPILEWLPRYPKEWLRLDLVAGLTAAAVVIPQAMAYATIAGLPVEVGLYTALVPMLVYAVLGTSRPLSVSATSTIAMLTATELARVAPRIDGGRVDLSGGGDHFHPATAVLHQRGTASQLTDLSVAPEDD